MNNIKEYPLSKGFIGSWIIPEKICDKLIKQFNDNKHISIDGTLGSKIYSVDKERKDSRDIYIDSDNFDYPFNEYRSYLDECLELYKLKFEGLKFVNQVSIKEKWNLQYYKPGGGFKVWHCENDGYTDEGRKRALVFMTYLNSVENGGTHFYYEQLTAPAIKGLTLIWPSDWTYLHKGQIAELQEKYIATGWISYD